MATRFFFGNIKVRLKLVKAKVTRGKDLFGKSEFFFGVSIKPRYVDFELFHQSAEAENCYGPFSKEDLSDKSKDDLERQEHGRRGVQLGRRDNGERVIWEGWLDTEANATITSDRAPDDNDIVMRLDFYLGERDLFGIGFSDNVVFRKQYYARAASTTSRI